jgi:hypothetical protein
MGILSTFELNRSISNQIVHVVKVVTNYNHQRTRCQPRQTADSTEFPNVGGDSEKSHRILLVDY